MREPLSSGKAAFRVGFSADFLDDSGALIFPDIGLSLLERVPGLAHEFIPEYRAEYIPDQLRDYDVLISLKPRVTRQSLDGVERLCAIGRCGVGYDNVDVAACTERDVVVYITRRAGARSVGESIVLFILALSHNLVQKDRMVRQGKWAQSRQPLGREPRNRVVGTIGLGDIACEAIRLLRPFGCARILAFDPYSLPGRAEEFGIEMVSLDELLGASDYVLINCALTAETRGMIGARELSLMKAAAYIINTARGAVIDEKALIAALQTGKISGAALDVFQEEPLDANSPLLRLENVIVTSHSIAWTEEHFRNMGRMDCEGALAVRAGRAPAHVVNPEVLQRPGFLQKLDRYKASAAEYA